MWHVTISEIVNQEPLTVHARTYKTKRGASNYIDRFTYELRQYFVISHTVTNDEIYLHCGGNGTMWEAYAYFQQ